MPRTTHLKAGHKAIQQYHAALKVYSGQHVEHEATLETAFQRLLADTARDIKGWTLIPKQSMKVGGRTVIPDGTLRDDFLRGGYWEAKDTHDDLGYAERSRNKASQAGLAPKASRTSSACEPSKQMPPAGG